MSAEEDGHGMRGIPARMKQLEKVVAEERTARRDLATDLRVEREQRQAGDAETAVELNEHAHRLDTIEKRLGIHESEAAKAWQTIRWLEKHVEALRTTGNPPPARRPPRKR